MLMMLMMLLMLQGERERVKYYLQRVHRRLRQHLSHHWWSSCKCKPFSSPLTIRCCCRHYYPFYTKETWDCKDIDNYQCSSLDQLFEVDVNLVITVLKDVMVTVIKCFDSCSNNDSDTFDGNPQCNNGYCHNLTSVYRCHINETNIMNQVILAITIIIIIIVLIIIIDILHGHCYQ